MNELEFIANRNKGIGSTDAQHLLEVGKYGCQRYLQIVKSNLFNDDLEEKPPQMLERGKFFEPIVAKLIAEKTNRTLYKPETEELRSVGAFIRGNADLLDAQDQTLIEIKTCNSHVFREVKKSGIPAGYEAQVRWLMMVYGTKSGEIWFYWPDGHELLKFDVEKDDAWENNAIEEAKSQWSFIEKLRSMQKESALALLSEKKDPSFSGCAGCPAKAICHPQADLSGQKEIEFNIEMTEKFIKLLELEPELDELTEVVSELKDDIKQFMLDNSGSRASYNGNSVTIATQSRENLDSKVKEVLTEEQKQKYTKKTSFPVMRITRSKK